MEILGMGIDPKGNAVFNPMNEENVIKGLKASLEPNAEKMRRLSQTTSITSSFKSEMERKPIDPADPHAVGWTFLVNSKDPQISQIKKSMEPLAVHRGMADPNEPLLYSGEPYDEWIESYQGLDLQGKKVPQYILIVGGPDMIPFLFQSTLDTLANVGRVAFDNLDDLDHYVEKLLRIEKASAPIVEKKAVLFAPDAGYPDPTFFSREYMVKPLDEHLRSDLNFATDFIQGDEATRDKLKSIVDAKPAIVYTASHGLIALNEGLAYQRGYNGAICCQHAGPFTSKSLFSADNVLLEQPFFEGSVFFQFACFGYGTPAESDYSHWLTGVPQKYADADFVAALPKKMLAHPRGPVAFIGHLDTAFLLGFTDPHNRVLVDRWHNRIVPFKTAVDKLLDLQPPGLAMTNMCKKYAVANTMITNVIDRLKRGSLKWDHDLEMRLLDTWLSRGDAQNYMIFGDPATHLRIP